MTPSPPERSSRHWVVFLLAVLLCLSAGFVVYRQLTTRIQYGSADWPWWRGPDRSGSVSGSAPQQWSASENVRWKVPIPGRGHGTPIVHGGHIYLASADEAGKELSLHCVGRENGESLWKTTLQSGDLMHKSIKNSYASASAACDGRRVYYPWIADGTLQVAALDLQGELVWQVAVAPFQSEHGYASSPCIYGSMVFVAGDNLGPSYLTALDRESGEIVWQQPRGIGGSYGTPVIAQVAGRDQLILSGQDSVVSYDPGSGEVLWQCPGPGPSTIGTVTWNDDLVFATCGAPPMIAGVLAIRGDSGEVAWQADAMANVPSALVVDDRLLVVEDRGTIRCLVAETGELLWRERLGGNFSASPILADGRVYLPSESGRLFVFRVGDEYELERTVDFDEGFFASPVIAGGQLFLRTTGHLYCIGAPDRAGE